MGLPSNTNALQNGFAQGYQIGRSLRFRSSASAYLNRTLTTPTSGSIWTYSLWVKRGALNSNQQLLSAGASVSDQIYFQGGGTDKLIVYLGASQTTTQVFRDPSAWYHFVFAVDTTQATASNRLKIYLNGSQITAFDATGYPTQNSTTKINSAVSHYIGRYAASASDYVDGYLAEVNFIDGQALTPSSFGLYDSNGIWQPIKYTGTYGTNGFYLPFSNTTSTTTLVADASGNGNNWTANNISLTAGATYDSMLDSPTNSNVGGNYCVLNPLYSAGGGTFSNGNLQVATGTSTAGRAIATMGVSSGKWYWEITPTSIPANVVSIGIVPAPTSNLSATVGDNASEYGYLSNGSRFSNGSAPAYGVSYVANDVIGIALDLDSLTVVFYVNGSSQGTAFSPITANTYIPAVSDSSSSNSATFVANFGQRPFSYTPPSGYNALNTANLPQPLISNGANYMAATLYTGNGSTQTINNSSGFYPDFNWIKNRSSVGSHVLVNSVVGGTKQLFSNLTDAEQTNTNITNGISSSGIALGNNTTGTGSTNQNTNTYVAWQWLAGAGTTSTNTSGSITSTVSVSAQSGFSIATYTGTGAVATVGHGLGVAPSMVIVKGRSYVSNWNVWHTSLTSAAYDLQLNTTTNQFSSPTMWNSTAPTSSVFSIGTSPDINVNGSTYVAYCFAAVRNYSAMGSYTGNGSSDGPFIYTGFRPRWIMMKCSTSAGLDWNIVDTSRNLYNVTTSRLWADLSNAEDSTDNVCDILSNGFKLRSTNTNTNASGATFIYLAFAESPFQISRAR